MATVEQKELIIALTTMMYNAPPGAKFMAEFEEALAQGLSVEQLAENLALTQSFSQQFPTGSTPQQNIELVLSRLGIDRSSSAFEEAFNFFNMSLNNGVIGGQVLFEAARFLSTTQDEKFQEPASIFKNKVEVGKIFTLNERLSSENLEALQSIFNGITSDPASTTSACELIQSLASSVSEDRNIDPILNIPPPKQPADNTTLQEILDSFISVRDDFELLSEKSSLISTYTNLNEGSHLINSVVSAAVNSIYVGDINSPSNSVTKLVVDANSPIFNTYSMGWHPGVPEFEITNGHHAAIDAISVYGGNEIYIDASASPASTQFVHNQFTEIPVFSHLFQTRATNVFIDTGNANSIVETPWFSKYGLNIASAMSANDFKLTAQLGSGVYGVKFSVNDSNLSDQLVSFGQSRIYGFNSDDYLIDDTYSSGWTTFDELLSNTSIQDGNTVINLPNVAGNIATITLVGFTDLTEDQFVNVGVNLLG